MYFRDDHLSRTAFTARDFWTGDAVGHHLFQKATKSAVERIFVTGHEKSSIFMDSRRRGSSRSELPHSKAIKIDLLCVAEGVLGDILSSR